MTDVLIQHCTLELNRTGGWCWPGSPDQIARQAMAALPELLERALADLDLAESIDIVCTSPIALELELSATEFGAMRQGLWPSRVVQQLRSAFSETLANESHASPPSRSSKPRLESTSMVRDSPSTPPIEILPSTERLSLIALLEQWRRQRQLEALLGALPSSSITAIWNLLFGTSERETAAEVTSGDLQGRLRQSVAEIITVVPPPPHPEMYRRWKIRMAMEACAIAKITASKPALSVAGIELAKRADGRSPATIATVDGKSTPATEPPASSGKVQDSSVSATSKLSARWDGEVRIASALPFLALGILDRLGYLQAVGAMLETAELTSLAPVFGAALAYKMLPGLERGWHRPEEARIAAATFVGIERTIHEDQTHELARLCQGHTGILDAFVLSCLAPGHSPDVPLYVARAEGGYELWEPEGLFPVAIARELTGLLPALAQFTQHQPPLLLDRFIVATEDLTTLDQSGFVLVTPNVPGRHQSFKSLFEGGQRLWSNHVQRLPNWFRPWLAAEQQQDELIEMRILRQREALDRNRNIAPLMDTADLNRSLTLAAALGLGTLSWELWGPSGNARSTPPEPLMALDTFENMEALVRFNQETIRVHLPLGQRYFGLEAHRMLSSISGVPWLPNRTVEFAKW